MVDSYVLLKDGQAYLLGALITPLSTASTHIQPDAKRTRKLLLHREEIDRLGAKTREKGFTIVPLQLYWSDGRAKVEIALARGKKEYDKRHALRERQDRREAERAMSLRRNRD
jgi:SsrA-binding protein